MKIDITYKMPILVILTVLLMTGSAIAEDLHRPPIALLNNTTYIGSEGSPITFNASPSYDSDGNTLQYRWDFTNDGKWDTNWSNSSIMKVIWYDDFTGKIKVNVSDGENYNTTTTNVIVNNVAPTVELDAAYEFINPTININSNVESFIKPHKLDVKLLNLKDVPVKIRIAGRPGSIAEIQIIQDGKVVGNGKVTRTKGRPNEETVNILSSYDSTKPYSGKIIFDTSDDKKVGTTAVWIVADGRIIKVKSFIHKKNTESKHQTYDFEFRKVYNFNFPNIYDSIDVIRILDEIKDGNFTFKATAYDPGNDSLSFKWEFGDGTDKTNSYQWNGSHTITDTVKHEYSKSGTYTLKLTVTDDNGGNVTVTKSIELPKLYGRSDR